MRFVDDVTFLDERGRLIRVCGHGSLTTISVEDDGNVVERLEFDDEAWAAITKLRTA